MATHTDSKAHGFDSHINRILTLTNIARISILFSLLVFFMLLRYAAKELGFAPLDLPLFGRSSAFFAWCAAYTAIIVVSTYQPNWQKQTANIPTASAVVDISMMAILAHLSGGIGGSVFGILLFPFLATACLLSYGRYPLLYGSYVALLIIIDTVIHYWGSNSVLLKTPSTLIPPLLLGGTGYFVALLTSFASGYLSRANTSIALQRSELANMNALNLIVLNRIREAVIIVDEQRHIWLYNQKAAEYFPGIQRGIAKQNTAFIHEFMHTAAPQSQESDALINHQKMYVRTIPVMLEGTSARILFIRAEHERQAEIQTMKLNSLGQLTANLAHEIRNPLSAMCQATGLLLEQHSDCCLEHKLCNIIDKNIARIDRMIEEVSLLSKSDRIHSSEIDPDKFCTQFQQDFMLTHPECPQCLCIARPLPSNPIRFDPNHLQQILWNLCNNAWQHSSRNTGAIRINMGEKEGGRVFLRIHDDGAGIDPNIVPNLFDPFFTTRAEGTGLGLYIARELAHANKGDLNYLPDSHEFELILPKATT